MQITQKTWFILILTGLILGGILFLYLTREEVQDVSESTITDQNGDPSSTTTVETEGGTVSDDPARLPIQPITLEEGQAITEPILDRVIIIPDFYPENAALSMRDKITFAREDIQNDSSLFEHWLELGNLYNDIHDFEGAVEIYEFLNKASPTNSITFVNAGNLYHLHLKDFPKAEVNFRQAIINNPTNEIAYSSFHELYKYSYKQNSTLAVDILQEGLLALPENVNFILGLATYYRDIKDTENARMYYTQAKEIAEDTGNSQLKDLIDTELQDL